MSDASSRSTTARRGIVYATTGAPYFREAVESARTAKKHMPDLPIIIFTDQPGEAKEDFYEVRPIHNVVKECLDKIEPLLSFPFEQTLFLDSDTVVYQPCYELFDLLERYDFLAATEPARHPDCYLNQDIPTCFAEVNTGVMAYRSSDAVRTFFADWLKRAREMNIPRDQAAFRDALYDSDVRFWTLTPEYNFRADYPGFLPAGSTIKILHARKGNLPVMKALADSSTKIRITLPGKDRLKPEHFLILAPRLHRIASLQLSLLQKLAGRKKGRS